MRQTITGYFGYVASGGRIRSTKVHLVDPQTMKPVCGCRVKGRFHWCAYTIATSYLTCTHCILWSWREMEERHKAEWEAHTHHPKAQRIADRYKRTT